MFTAAFHVQYIGTFEDTYGHKLSVSLGITSKPRLIFICASYSPALYAYHPVAAWYIHAEADESTDAPEIVIVSVVLKGFQPFHVHISFPCSLHTDIPRHICPQLLIYA